MYAHAGVIIIIIIIIIKIIIYKIYIPPYTICKKIALRRFTNIINVNQFDTNKAHTHTYYYYYYYYYTDRRQTY